MELALSASIPSMIFNWYFTMKWQGPRRDSQVSISNLFTQIKGFGKIPIAGFRWVSDKMKVLKILYTTEFTYSAENCSGRNEGCRTQLTCIKMRKTKTTWKSVN